MPTETQLEQRVAALQSDLNERDQRTDDMKFQLKDREGSRRDWFEAAQAAEKQLAYAVDALNEVVKASAMYERPFEIATLAIGELSASAEPSAPKCCKCNGTGETAIKGGQPWDKRLSIQCYCTIEGLGVPVERDERAEFEQAFVVQEGVFFSKERNEYRSMNGRSIEYTDATDLNLRLQGWQARAALDKATEGAGHE
ncbi:hypothetical protein [Pseudomonas protegens]|uniref:hypothetical protein n=1 Tax=Pseudomonas protegens TaxID=380021 RepID=UPI00320AB1A8